MPQQWKDSASSSTRFDSSAEPPDAQPAAPPKESVTGSWLQPPLSAITAVTLRFPVATLVLAVSLAAVAAIYALMHLGYRSSRLDLLNPKSPYNRLWIQYINEFGDEDDAVIVVEGPGREQIIPVIDELSSALGKNKRLFHSILKDKDLSKIVPKSLHYAPVADLQDFKTFVDANAPTVSGEWSRLEIGKCVAGMALMIQAAAAEGHGAEASPIMGQLDRTVVAMLAQFSANPRYQSPWPDAQGLQSALGALGNEYIVYKNGQMGILALRIAMSSDELARGSESIDALRTLIAESSARHPGIKIGLTGLPILENDEMRASQSSMFWGGILSFIGVVIVVVAGFGGLRHAILANVVLLIGTAWAFGYATLAIGHLNLLSITFTATLVGVGIDYGTYYVSRYMQYRREGQACHQALTATTRIAGPAIITGALTTVVAFFATGVTNFKGIAELGIIAGGGILLCALAQLFVLPALVRVVDESPLGAKMPRPVPVHTGIAFLMKAPRLVMAIGVLLTIVACFGVKSLWFDYNLLNLQPEGLESVTLEHKLLTECDQSMWYAISMCESREELLAKKAKFEKLQSVDRTDEIVDLLVGDDRQKRPIIEQIGNCLANLPERPPLILVETIDELGVILQQAQELIARDPQGAQCAGHIETLRDCLRRLPAADCYSRISQFQQQMAGDLLSRLHTLRSVANPEPPKLSDLPEGLVNRFVGHSGKLLLKVYGKGDLHDMDALARFVKDVRSVDPRATGNPLQTYECSLEMKRSYEHATIYSLIVIFGVLYFDFRNLKHCALAAFPQFMGILMTFGLLGYLKAPLNPANLIAVPMILGIGVDYSVYVVHEYLEQKGRYRMSPGTAIAVTVDSLTTLIGYGSLLIASHRGLQSLGRVLTIAVTFCTLMSIIVLPAFLVWITRKRPLVPWVGDAVESFDHVGETSSDNSDSVTRRAA
jgi:hopanoid biosynthesis associated RND transporter like protein HpnN